MKKCHGIVKVTCFAKILIFFFFFINILPLVICEAAGEDMDYTGIQKALDDALSNEEGMDFGGYVGQLVDGEKSFSVGGVLDQLKNSVYGEIDKNIGQLALLLTIAVIAAVFTTFAHSFQDSQVAETGFYVTYLLMFGILAASFTSVTVLAANTISRVLDFMKALVPTYCLSLAFSTGAGTSFVFYEAVLILVTVVDFILLKVMLPMINIYMVCSLANNISKEHLLSKLAEMIAMIVRWGQKFLLALVIGIGTVQGLIAPAADNVKRLAITKFTGAIPGIGNLLSGVTDTVLGAGSLLKNAIGVAGMVAIAAICAVPLLKLGLHVVLYRLGGAVIQPVSDNRIINCLGATAEASLMLLKTVIVGAVLFLISITIVSVSTLGK